MPDSFTHPEFVKAAPDIVEAYVTNESTGLALEHLIRRGITVTWVEQRGQLMRSKT